MVKLLTENKADLNIETNDAATPFMISAHQGKNEIIKYLFSNGANIEHKDKSGSTALLIGI